ncbi:Aste57867_16500 [Aphanomyces stellatus]|uniref:Aste57867_16500 protein n=1 Tax=Aphanomyces stellatus TaxID=120398 RepID=A0A485L5K9_9STRA|nr:hypothetical protein As57867_016443 [Aphanomyces stellatus]VFT93274.1 Aste57867_16500 [Aphanomyces stellatus]
MTSAAVALWIPAACAVVTASMTIYYLRQLCVLQEERSRATKKDHPGVTAAAPTKCVKLCELTVDEVPLVLRPSYYFSHRHDFKHRELFHNATNVFDVLDGLHAYCEQWICDYTPETASKAMTTTKGGKVGSVALTSVDPAIANGCTLLNYETNKSRRLCIEEGVRIMGGVLDVTDGSIFLGKNVVIEPNVYIKGPAIIGDGTVLRHGAYLRGDVVIGKDCVIRCEMKHSARIHPSILSHATLGYCGDSLCGYKSHFANQVSTANLNLLSTDTICIDVLNVRYDTGQRKIGVVLGDFSQLGCNAATDPCTLIGLNTAVYPLTRVNKGFYGPNEILKNKPMEHGVVERTKLRVTGTDV